MKHLLFFLLLIIPAGLRADLITPNGYGSFSCTYSAADSGYVVDGQLSFVAQDAQGNPLDATLHFGMQNASPCAPGLPGLVALAQPGVGMGLSGNWDYLGHNYTALSWPDGSGWCESNLPGDLCSAALISDGVGNLGIQLIQQVPAGGTEGNDDGTPASDPSPGGNGNLILSPFYGLEEASNDPFVTLQIAGPITITSLDYGVNNDDCFDPTTYASGTFTVGCVPEPAEWGLLVAALPILIFKYRRSKK
jgi:hypothetical protein